MSKLDEALAQFFEVVREEHDDISEELRDAATAMCRADMRDPHDICVGNRNMCQQHGGIGRFVLHLPISPAWVDYVTLAKAALDAQDR